MVKFFADIRKLTGNTKELKNIHASNVRELIEILCKKYGSKFKSKVFPQNQLSDEIIILVNGIHISHLDGIDTPLNQNDVISIFPMIFGG